MNIKKYKTCEAIKMLEENPRFEFITKDSYGSETKLFVTENNLINLRYLGTKVFSENIRTTDEWTLLKEPITWKKALKSHKNFKIEHELITSWKYNNYLGLGILIEYLSKDYEEDELIEILNEAKLYEEVEKSL